MAGPKHASLQDVSVQCSIDERVLPSAKAAMSFWLTVMCRYDGQSGCSPWRGRRRIRRQAKAPSTSSAPPEPDLARYVHSRHRERMRGRGGRERDGETINSLGQIISSQ